MTFLSPWWLLLLVPIALMAAAYVVQQSRRSKYAVRFASLPMLERLIPRRPGWRRHLPAIASLFGFVLLALAVARPEMEVRVPRENATVMVAVDVSNSMQATDIDPNRLAAASKAATKFVDDLPQGFNVGVVTFSGTTEVRAAPTDNRKAAVSRAEEPHPRPADRDRGGRLHLARPDRVGRVPGQEEEGARARGAPLGRHQHVRAVSRGGCDRGT